ncbi:MAG: class I SAM-dependent methyltransferase [Solirubrobacterales bacterium]
MCATGRDRGAVGPRRYAPAARTPRECLLNLSKHKDRAELRRVPRRWARRAYWRVVASTHRALELRYGIRTEGDIDLEDLGVAAEHRLGYEGSHWVGVRRALRRLTVTRADVFADFGSGKGPAVLVAATFPFRRALGVEISDDLTRSAQRNLERSRMRPRAESVEFVTADVLEYEIPDDLSVVYLYNPFTGLLFARFLERLLRSLERRPRPLRLVYNYPFEHNHVIASGRFRPIDLSYSYWPAWYRRPGYVILTYEALAPDGGSYAALPGKRSSPERLGPWRDRHDPGWELVGPQHATATDANRARELEVPNRP